MKNKIKIVLIIGVSMIVAGFSINQIILDALPHHYPRSLFVSMQTLVLITAVIGLSGILVTIMGIVFGWRRK